jgi:hypothetical protein
MILGAHDLDPLLLLRATGALIGATDPPGTNVGTGAETGAGTDATFGLWESSHTLKSSLDTALTAMGIKPWRTPHSSEHCP